MKTLTKTPTGGRRLARLVLLISPLALLGNTCSEPINQDPYFEKWCGPVPCDWEVDEGSVARVATWHAGDDGLALLGDRASISQLTDRQTRCLDIDLLTDIDPDSTVLLELDFQDDGTAEYSQPIDGHDWKRLEFRITPPTWYETVRIRVRKLSGGRAILARIRVGSTGGCEAEPLALLERRPGARCEAAAQCASGVCGPTEVGLCSETPELVGCDATELTSCARTVGPASECWLIATEDRCE